jgi:hypothetical protein
MLRIVPTFAARRSYRPRWTVFGLAFVLAGGACAAALAVTTEAHSIAAGVGIAGAVGYLVATIASMIPQRVSLVVEGSTLTPSWRRAVSVEAARLGTWVIGGIDVATGLVLHVGGLRIGGDKHDGEGYAVTGPPARAVDCHLERGEFEALLAAVGIRKGPPGPLVVPLVRSAQSLRAMVSGMAPWLVTIAVMSVIGVILNSTDAGRALAESREGQLGLAIGTSAAALACVAFMILRARRVRAPELVLRADPDALVLVRGANESRTPWPAITTQRLRYSQSSRVGTYTMPILVLALGEGGKALRLGAWDAGLAWPGQPAKAWRGPQWLVGAAHWPRLLDALARHHRL